jgi:hypothetical protein
MAFGFIYGFHIDLFYPHDGQVCSRSGFDPTRAG